MYDFVFHPLRNYPGPFLAKFTNAYGGVNAARRRLHLVTHANHLKYGKPGPREVSVLEAESPLSVKTRLRFQTSSQSTHIQYGEGFAGHLSEFPSDEGTSICRLTSIAYSEFI